MDIFDTIEPKTKKRDIFDTVEAPLKRMGGAFRGAGATGGWTEEGLAVRGLKQFANILPETAKETIYGLGGGKVASFVTAGLLNRRLKKMGIKAPSLRETQKLVKQRILKGTKIPELEIAPPTTIGEKAVDIVTGVGKFVTKLAVLRKVMPGVPEAALWEMENISSGGIPGMGYAMHGAFSAPGKIIKGIKLPSKAGRLAAESAALMGVTGIEQKINTGELQWQDIATSGLIPGALRLPRAAKFGISKLLHSPLVSGRITTLQARRATVDIANKAKQTGIPVEQIVGNIQLRREASRIVSRFPQKIKDQASLEQVGKAIKEHMGLGDWGINWILAPKSEVKKRLGRTVVSAKYDKVADIFITEPSGYLFFKGKYKPTKKLAGAVARKKGEAYRHTQGEAKRTIVHELGHLAQRPYLSKKGRRIAHSKEFADWVNTKVNDLFMERPGRIMPVSEVGITKLAKPVTIDTANKAITDWSKIAKLLNKTERKAAVHKLRQQQHARYTAKKELELERGASSFQAHIAAKKVRGGKAGTPEIEPLILSPVQMEVYGRQIETAYPKHKGFQRAGAYDAITKMTNGKIPTNYEFGLLEPVFGTKATVKLVEALKGKKAIELVDIPMLVRDIPKALRFGFDPQAARGLSKMTIRHPLIYLTTLGKNIRGIFSKKYADRVSTTIEKSPVYKLGKKNYGANYLSMKPWASVEAGTKLEQYGHVSEIFLKSGNRVIRGIGRWLRASERGANLGMNSALNKLVIKGEKDLARYSRNKSLSEKDIAAWRRRRGHDINIFTKRVTAKHPKIKAIQRAANWVVFSPSYTASGLAAGPQSFIKLATGKGFADRTYAMQIMLSRAAGLSAASSMVAYIGYKWRLRNPTEEPVIDSSPNPIDPLFGKIRRGEDVYDLGFGDVADYRLMAHIGVSAHMATKELLTGKQVTTVGKKKPPSAGEAFSRYLNSKRTLYLTLGKQLLTGKDWLGNPVTLKDTALDNLPFEFIQAFVEAGEADGIWEDMVDGMALDATKKALGNLGPAIAALGGVGTGSYPVHAAVTRYKFQDIIAEQKHGKAWDRLTLREQNRLKSEHRKQFEVLSERVRKERVDVPFSMERIQKEEREANKRVSKMLSKESRGLVKDIDLGVSRRPKNWYLDDERYNRYQELVAQFVDERLSKVDFIGMEEKRRIARVQIIVKVAKNKALTTLRREVGR